MKKSQGKTAPRLPHRLGACLLAAAAGVALTAAVGGSAGAEEYSAYSDPDKTALAVILSEGENAEDFQEEFGLSEGEMDRVLASVRAENKELSEEFAESEEIIAANRSLPDEKVAEKVAASDYDETVEDTIAQTKESVTGVLPDGDQADLRSWVDARWQEESEAAATDDFARIEETKAGGRRVVCKVFATQYIGYTRYEASLPHRTLKFGSRPRVVIKRVNGNVAVRPRIKEVGPWNTYDNYWQTKKNRTMWKSLSRCVPEAHAAYYRNFNRGKDEFGREVLNPAGVDLTPAVASDLRLGRYQNAWVYVKFPWLRR